MQRRQFMICSAAGMASLGAQGHHGWSSFDQDRPLYLEGKAERVAWRNPHAELKLRLANPLRLPDDLASRKLPAQSAGIDSARILAATQLPRRRDPLWEIELAPLTRMQAWQVAEIKTGQSVAVIGYSFTDEKGEALLRVEYLLVDGKSYALRSAPV